MKIDKILLNDTIVALATAHGNGAIAIIRLSGKDAINICQKVFLSKSLKKINLLEKDSHTLHFGVIQSEEGIIDEVLVSLFKGPNSYTGEDTVEISCHGSIYIQQQLLQLFTRQGARIAQGGEFTLRAFLNGKLDLSQAEAVADLIASNSSTSHQVAVDQMRGGFSNKIKILRQNLVDFASLLELELDFSEEDVEFANRKDLKNLIISIQKIIKRLIESFEVGNVIKHGIPVTIVGKPNAGKSTLLNALLEDDKAIVSEIPGTTRDVIEDEMVIEGVLFRFIDTAGLRETTNIVESIGVAKAYEKLRQSSIAIYLFDVHNVTSKELSAILLDLKRNLFNSQLIVVGNKIDKEDLEYTKKEFEGFKEPIVFISAKEKRNLGTLKEQLLSLFDSKAINVSETVVTNARHAEALRNTNKALQKVIEGLNQNITSDLLAIEVRSALDHLGSITGEVTSDDLLGNIFSKFCIGK